ncbi:MAG: FlgD immunoglobulin-like domain containing protein, partial [Candidatus Binatia bacterium]
MRVRLLRYSIGFLVLALGSSHTLAAAARAILHNVTVSPRFFNPSLGQTEEIRFQARSTERVTVSILDRDRFVIRTFWAKIVKQGPQAMKWDGKDDRGVVVPDEAYSIKIEFQGGKHPAVYDPSLKFMPISENPAKRSYSRTDGILTYSIARTSRVHIEAGEAVKNEKTGEWEGPILKTIVDRQPRIAGAISDKWSGFDEGGT